MNGVRNASPTRQTRGECYTMFTPNERKRQQLVQTQKDDERNLEEYKKNNQQHYNIVQRVGRANSGQPVAANSGLPPMAENRPSQTPAQRARMKREEERQRKDRELEEMKKKKREEAESNEERARRKAQSQQEDHKKVNAAFLAQFERRAPTVSSAAAANTVASAATSVSNETLTDSASASGVDHAEFSSGFAGFSVTNQLRAKDFKADALIQLQRRFPYVEREVLEDLLLESGYDIESVTDLLSS